MSKGAGCLLLLVVFPLALLTLSGAAQAETNALVNGGFEHNLLGWTAEGAVAAAPHTLALASAEKASLRIGPGKGAVRQRYTIGGLRIVQFGATLRSDPPEIGGTVRVQCYDAHNRLLMDLAQDMERKQDASQASGTGIYFKTQARTAALVVSIERNTEKPGYLYASSAELFDYDRDRAAHAPRCDLRQSLRPVWQGTTVYNETVLLRSDGGKPASGSLLFTPKRLLAVRDYGLTTTFIQGRDFTLAGRTLTCTPASRMASVKDSDFPAGELGWYDLDGKHVVVTYTHEDAWRGPAPQYEGSHLPRTMEKLRRRLPLTVVADGDSITLGDNVSGYLQIPPYLPTWAELFVVGLKQLFGDPDIRLYNTALGGMTSAWGLENADRTVAALEPDLVIIAFGMNDFWSLSGDEFRRNIQGIIGRVRTRRPHAEFLLVSSMRFDPAYTADPTYTGHMAAYAAALRSLTGEGVRLLDMNAFSGALFAAKKPKDLIANPLHPNDFLVRWYAQGLVAMLTPPRRSRQTARATPRR